MYAYVRVTRREIFYALDFKLEEFFLYNNNVINLKMFFLIRISFLLPFPNPSPPFSILVQIFFFVRIRAYITSCFCIFFFYYPSTLLFSISYGAGFAFSSRSLFFDAFFRLFCPRLSQADFTFGRFCLLRCCCVSPRHAAPICLEIARCWVDSALTFIPFRRRDLYYRPLLYGH